MPSQPLAPSDLYHSLSFFSPSIIQRHTRFFPVKTSLHHLQGNLNVLPLLVSLIFACLSSSLIFFSCQEHLFVRLKQSLKSTVCSVSVSQKNFRPGHDMSWINFTTSYVAFLFSWEIIQMPNLMVRNERNSSSLKILTFITCTECKTSLLLCSVPVILGMIFHLLWKEFFGFFSFFTFCPKSTKCSMDESLVAWFLVKLRMT